MRDSIKFAEEFELDLRTYELRRAGRVLRLERIPMQILIYLVERRQDLVTRQEIVERVWGQGVFFDTDNSINVAIRKIRQALGDDPESPRFIRTVTGIGYRFIAPASAAGVEPAVLALPPEPAVRPVVADSPAVPPVTADSPAALPPALPRADDLRAGTAQDAPLPGPLRTVAPPASSAAASSIRRWGVALATLVLAGIAGFYLHWLRSGPVGGQPGERTMLAVLPFENLTGDPGQEYYADGFTEEMITRLGSLNPGRLGVIARTSVMSYKRKPVSVEDIGRALGVQYMLEGSIRSDQDRVRVTAQLIRIADQTHLWARQYDRERTRVLQVQQEIADAVAAQIEPILGEALSPPRPPAAPSPGDYEAYDLCIRGRYAWNKRTPEGFREAIELYEQAIARNSGEVRAHAGLADVYSLMGSYSLASQAEVVPKARAAALKALEIAPGFAAAQTSLALINEFYDWDWPTAGERFRKAIALDPNDVTVHHWYAEYLAFQGRFEEALAEIDLARRLDPLSRIVAADRGAILYYARRYDDSIEQFRSVLAAEPGFRRAHLIAYAYAQQGQYDDALEHIEQWERMEPGPWPRAYAACVYGRSGRKMEARLAAREIESADPGWKGDMIVPRAVAAIGMGLHGEAFAALQQACAHHSNHLVALGVDPIYDPLRDDIRFQDLLRCVNLVP